MTGADLPAGAWIGPYVVERKLGEGGMGQVYLARTPGGRRVAVKVMKPAIAGSAGFRERFRSETTAARRISGAFTAAVIAADADAPLPWLATEYIDAPSLADVVEARGPLPSSAVRRLAAGLAEALAALHDAGIVHRDVKPSNILLAQGGPRLIDFGIARAIEGPSVFRPGRRPIGSPGYISPERWIGQAATQAADIFALGAVLCFAATGEGPFGVGPVELIDARSAQLAPDLDAIPDPLVQQIVKHCLARDAGVRPSPRDVLAMLEGRPFIPGSAGGTGRGWPRRRKLMVGTGAGTAVVLGLILALTLPGSAGNAAGQGGGGSAAAHGYVWAVEQTGSDLYVGIWGGQKDVVVGGMFSGLTAYDAQTGAKLWSWKPPSGNVLCGMTESLDGGEGAFDYGPTGSSTAVSCDELQTVSTGSGKLGWSAPVRLSAVTGSAPNQAGGKALAISDGIVSAAYFAQADATGLGADPDLIAVDEHTGRTKWATNFGQNPMPDGCVLTGIAGVFDSAVRTLGECGGDRQVELLDVTGAAGADVQTTGSLGDCATASASAMAGYITQDADYLLIACPGGNASTGLYAMKSGTTAVVGLAVPSTVVLNPADGANQPQPGGIVLSGSMLYVSSPGITSSGAETPPMVTAFNLADGADQWTHIVTASSFATPLAATSAGPEVLWVNSTTATGGVDVLNKATGAVSTTAGLDSGEVASFTGISMDTLMPYSVAVGPRLAIGFPTSFGQGQVVAGVLATG